MTPEIEMGEVTPILEVERTQDDDQTRDSIATFGVQQDMSANARETNDDTTFWKDQ